MAVYSERRRKTGLPDPFRTYSNYVYPRSLKDVFIWASYLWERNAAYRTSIHKVVAYFLSDINVKQDAEKSAVDTNAIASFKDLLTDDYEMMEMVMQFGEELAAMGNVFVSAERVFSRELECPNDGCGWQMHLKSLRKGRDYDWDGEHFVGTCPQCGQKVQWRIKDVKSTDKDGRNMRFVFRSAEDMRLQYNRLTGTYKYIYKIPDDAMDAIRRGDAVYLEDTPQVFLEAAAKGLQFVTFPEDMFFSMRTRTLSNLDKLYKGWGMPLFMVAFDNVIQLQHLNKFNEAVVLDYLVPTRIVSPAPQNLKAGIDDPNRMPMSGAAWRNMMGMALQGRVTNPTQWILSPIPVQEQQVGGDKSVIPTELLEYTKSQMQEDICMPLELRQTNFQTVAPTMGMRMFERVWVHFAKGMSRFVSWAGEIIAKAHHFEDMECSLDMTSFIEDDMNKQVLLGLMQSNLIAKTPVMRRLGVDYEDDLKLQVKEQEMQAQAFAEEQEDQENTEMVQAVMPPAGSLGLGQAQMNIQMMQQQAQGGAAPEQPGMPAQPAMPEGGMPALPFNQGASQSASLEQLYQQAQQLAQQLYSAPYNIRRQQLVQLKANNPELHAMVKQMMSDMAQQTASEAVAQSRQPQG